MSKKEEKKEAPKKEHPAHAATHAAHEPDVVAAPPAPRERTLVSPDPVPTPWEKGNTNAPQVDGVYVWEHPGVEVVETPEGFLYYVG
jgi:hypothetical protein